MRKLLFGFVVAQAACFAGCSDARAPVSTHLAAAGTGQVSGGGSSAADGGVASSGAASGLAGASNVNGGAAGSAAGDAGEAGSAGAAAEVSSLPGCELSFPYNDEPGLGTWLGGDSAYSIALSAKTALWSFQDTFVGEPGQHAREGAAIIGNSYALVSCENGVQSIRYVWKLAGNTPKPILDDGSDTQRFWPQQPIIYEGVLFQAMTRVVSAADEVGTSLARVANPYDSPDEWQVQYFDLAALSGLGKGTLVVDDYAYMFGTSSGQAIVTRLRLAELIKPEAVPKELLEYLASDGSWKQGLAEGDAKKLGFAANVGTSFRYLKDTQQWLVLFTSTAGWPSRDVAVSTAPKLEGPWSKPVTVYQVPEMTSGSPEYDADNVCYCAVEHNESNPAPETELLFSYTCNSLVFAKQLQNLGIYLPKIVTLENPILN